MDVPDSTLAGLETGRREQPSVWARRAFLTALLALALAGLAGLLGVRTTTASTGANGYELSVTHAEVARAGLDVPWQVTVNRPGGFGKALVLAVSGDYFDMYETQGFTPEPSSSTRDADTLYLTFEAPEGDTFIVDYDAYIQPSSQLGQGARVAVVDAGHRTLASVDIGTVLLP